MFSFLNSGNINTTIRGITNLPGLFTSDGDKIKYALVNYSTAMRTNLANGAPIFAGIRQLEAEIERRDIASITSGRLPSMAAAAAAAAAASNHPSSIFNDIELHIDNAALAVIMAKELAFLNRTIQMISLIANRYHEEQEDLEWGCGNHDDDNDLETGADAGADDTPSSDYYEDDSVPSVLCRSSSSYAYDDDDDAPASAASASKHHNQLSASFLISSGRLRQRFNGLCVLAGTDVTLVNQMTTMNQPRNEANHEKQICAEKCVISNIFLYFEKHTAEHRDPVVNVFLELRDISVTAWRVMSMFAFSNLFRLTEGSEFEIYTPEEAIFTQGRDYTLRAFPSYDEVAVLRFPKAEVLATPAIIATEEAAGAGAGAGAGAEDAVCYD
jgi:hypothetical protein